MNNIHAGEKGRKVVILPTYQGNVRAWNFPGWGAPDYADYLVAAPVGMVGTVTMVESHGSNPWTRYSLELANGSTTSGAVAGRDFRFAA